MTENADNFNPMHVKGQDNLVILTKHRLNALNVLFSNSSSDEIVFNTKPSWNRRDVRMKLYVNGPGQDQDGPYVVILFKNLVLQIYWADCVSWYVASGKQVLFNHIKMLTLS